MKIDFQNAIFLRWRKQFLMEQKIGESDHTDTAKHVQRLFVMVFVYFFHGLNIVVSELGCFRRTQICSPIF